jgi:dienelactone hydrolase
MVIVGGERLVTIGRHPSTHRYSSLPQPMSNDNAVIQNEVNSGGIAGRFFRPSADDIRGAIIVLGGSGGGLGWSGDVAAQLCAEGYAALALAYFRWPGLPKKLVGIRLEYVASAIRWLERTTASAASPVAVIGASRGAELALLAASKFSQVRVVVGVAPSSVLWGPDGGIAAMGRPAWTFGGLALPAMRSPSAWWPPRSAVGVLSSWMSGTPWRNTPLCLKSLQDVDAVARAAIPAEQIMGHVLLISGGDDQLWPSRQMGEAIIARLQAAGHPFEARHLSYDGAGHAVSILKADAYPTLIRHPITRLILSLGGTEDANRKASASARAEALAFLGRHLGTER